MRVTISWATRDEAFVVRPADDLVYNDGDQILVLVSTETSTSRGCYNGHPRVEAVKVSPTSWYQNLA